MLNYRLCGTAKHFETTPPPLNEREAAMDLNTFALNLVTQLTRIADALEQRNAGTNVSGAIGNAQEAATPKKRGRPSKETATALQAAHGSSATTAVENDLPYAQPDAVEDNEPAEAAETGDAEDTEAVEARVEDVIAEAQQAVVDLSDFQDFASAVRDEGKSNDTIKALFVKYGVAKMSAIPENKRAAFLADVRKA